LTLEEGIQSNRDRPLEEKLSLLLESRRIPEEFLGQWLREQGLHSQQLTVWEQELRDALSAREQETREELLAAKQKIREQERELKRRLSSAEAQSWMGDGIDWYNRVHRHSGLGYITPEQRRKGEDLRLFALRNHTVQKAFSKHPKRFPHNGPKEWRSKRVVYLFWEKSMHARYVE
ncbi:MAG: hypothetical protein ACUVQP_07820, partial [Bacteroidales bacterium]